jgi:hypothetical protein
MCWNKGMKFEMLLLAANMFIYLVKLLQNFTSFAHVMPCSFVDRTVAAAMT